ncbi:unnamed protein product [Kluyveromyces dobzhanskii CBS 2104]|uniref:DASH complex subunit DAD1 n=1 Tax=Kluyveromyces dobzhanskii CBS 2104 TaxID=1427455 RepID=A0A0A8KZZ0_9SACH|nr:unnamed protein product [Kluyveromyces dobzhanskii CBS 2104]
MTEEAQLLSAGDKYFIEQRELVLQDINQSMDAILNQLNGLNITLENSIAVGKEFENVSQIWKLFYNGLELEEQTSDSVPAADSEHNAEDVEPEIK